MFLSPLNFPFHTGSTCSWDLAEDIILGLQKVFIAWPPDPEGESALAVRSSWDLPSWAPNPDTCGACREGFRGHGSVDLLNLALNVMRLPWVWPFVVGHAEVQIPALKWPQAFFMPTGPTEAGTHTAHVPIQLHTPERGFGKKIIISTSG